jgi:MoaA/NifB/PqqE/SkfB family radical SAM enzyme
MITLEAVKVLHLEITSHCNAACPACDRFRDGEINPHLTLNDLSPEDISEKLDIDFIQQLDKMFMCGNHGDPAASKHTLSVYRWFREINPEITLGMNTNGGIKTAAWWAELGSIINRELDYVVFSIDGLEDTNHLYRRNVNWQRLMANVKAFIAAGGKAQWDMLVFKHNLHQVEAAKQLAHDMGFTDFRCKVSKRSRTWEVFEMPEDYGSHFHEDAEDIDCAAIRDASIYMDSSGRVLPCCWLGIDAVNNGNKYPVPGYVPTAANPVCLKTCGIRGKSNFDKQWIDL